jgi:hypothetical protein
VGISSTPGTDAALDPDLARAAGGIGAAVAVRLRELAPALRAVAPAGGEPTLALESLTLEPDDPLDDVTLAACVNAHDAYVAARGRPAAVSPGALALARILTWAARAEMLGRAPDVRWIGPPSRRPEAAAGHAVAARVLLRDADGTAVRAAAVAVVA